MQGLSTLLLERPSVTTTALIALLNVSVESFYAQNINERLPISPPFRQKINNLIPPFYNLSNDYAERTQ